PVNDAPVIQAAGPFTIDEDIPLTGVFKATDADGDPLTFSLITPPANGTLTLQADGSFSYQPAANYNGTDSFEIQVSDGHGGTVSQIVSLTISPVNDAPVAQDHTYIMDEDGGSQTGNVLTDAPVASDVDGDALTAVLINDLPAEIGTLVFNADGSFSFTPAANFNGTATFSYQACDNGLPQLCSAEQTVTITVNPVNDTPVASSPVQYESNEDTPIEDQLFATDADGDVLTFSLTTPSANGAVTVNADGSFKYLPNANYNGTDSFMATVSDGNGGTALISVNISINPVNDAPTAVSPISITTDENVVFNGQLTADDADGELLSFTLETQSAHGTVVLDNTPTLSGTTSTINYTYTPAGGYNQDDHFQVLIQDAAGATTLIHVHVLVNPVNDAPVIQAAGPFTIDEDTNLTGVFKATDADGDPLTFSLITPPANGTLTLQADGSFSYQPAANYNGTDSFEIQVSDGHGGTVSQIVSLTISPVNDAPVAQDHTYIMDEDGGSINGNVLSDAPAATDIDGDALTAVLINDVPAEVGTLVFNANGSFSFTPTTNFRGTVSFSYQACDNGLPQLCSQEQTVTITVNPVNDAPVASSPVNYVSNEDTPVADKVTATDIDGDELMYSLKSGAEPLHGSVSVSANGTFSYTPSSNYNGLDSFIIVVDDGKGGSSEIVVNVLINPANDNPVAISPVLLTTDEDKPVKGQVSATDVDGDALSYVGSNSLNGSLQLDIDGSFTYTPRMDFFGKDSLVVTINDGNGGTASVNVYVQVNPINDAPVPVTPLELQTNESLALNSNLSATDLDGDALSYSLEKNPLHGSLTLNADGSFIYTPTAGFTGADQFSGLVDDGNGGSAMIQVNITVLPFNNPPIANAIQQFQMNEDEVLSAKVEAQDPDGDALSFELLTSVLNGTIQLDQQTGSFVYTPNSNFNGTDEFSVDISDGNGEHIRVVVNIVIIPVNDFPVAITPVSETLGEDNSLSSQVQATDVDGDQLTYSINTAPMHGSILLNANGTYTYTPFADYNGTDSFSVTADDGNGGTTQITVQLEITPVNDAPVAENTNLTTDEDVPLDGTLSATDVDNDVLAYSVISEAANGLFKLNQNGDYNYVPYNDFNGQDSITVQVNDGNGGLASFKVYIEIRLVYDQPRAFEMSFVINENEILTNKLEAVSVDNNPLTFGLAQPPQNGFVEVNEDGTFTYKPNLNFNGSDSFKAKVMDDKGGSVEFIVSILINPINSPPETATPINLTINEDTPYTDKFVAIDPEGDPITFVIGAVLPEHGTVTVNSDGSYLYTPAKDYLGSDSFTARVLDDKGGLSTIAVNITIIPVNDAPVTSNLSYDVVINEPKTLNIAENVSDIDGPLPLVYSVSSAPQHGTITQMETGNPVYTPNLNYIGPDSFAYTVCDSFNPAGCSTSTVELTVKKGLVDVQIVKTASNTKVDLNQSLSFNLLVQNNDNKNAANQVTVIDTLPEGFVYVSANASVGDVTLSGSNIVTWVISSLAAQQSAQLTINVTAIQGGDFINTAIATSTESDADPSNNKSSVSVEVFGFKVANVFTPNGDGINDTFTINGVEDFDAELQVFNRWGGEVFKRRPYKNDWDGSDLPEGTYFYSLRIKNKQGNTKVYTGYITILR
ncbi:Ig-like domain-containing protein, partial [Solitalea sp. MAHUQ-68]